MTVGNDGDVTMAVSQIHVVPWPDRLHVASDECLCAPTLQEDEPDDEDQVTQVWQHRRISEEK